MPGFRHFYTGRFTSTAAAQEETTASEWSKYFEVYGWLPNMYITPAEGAPITITLGDILSNLDMVAMVDFGAQKGRWSFAMDSLYMNLGKKFTREGETRPAEVDVDLDMRSFISTVNAGYQFNKRTATFGVRYLRWNFDGNSELQNLRVLGPYMGAKWTF